MKKSTRLAAFLAAALLWLPTFGCASKTADTPNEAIKRTLSLSSYAATITEETTKGEIKTFSAYLSLSVEQSGNAPVYEAQYTEKEGDKTRKKSVYCSGEWYYIDDGELYYKSNTTQLTEAYRYIDRVAELVKAVEDVAWEKSENAAETVYTTQLSATVYEALFANLVSEADWEDVSLTVKVQKRYVTEYALKWSKNTDAGEVIRTHTACFQSPGQKVAATPPTGYQNYPEHGFS